MTEEKKGVSAWLRGIIDECEVDRMRSCTAIAEAFGIDCKHEKSCRDCIARMMMNIADRIDAERALPEGVEWPRFEDGEMVKFGDEVEFEGEAAKVLDVAFSVVRFSLGVGTATTSGRVYGFLGEPAKRPAPKVLDADGVPIKVGDTVYCDGEDEPLRVSHITDSTKVTLISSHASYYTVNPSRLSHERPDSWEKLGEDMMRGTSCRYFGGVESALECWDCPHGTEQTGTPCWKNERIDILRRAKKLAGIEEEAQR